MLLPTQLLPEEFGLAWGLPQEQCLAALGILPTRTIEKAMLVTTTLSGEQWEVDLRFDEGGLGCVVVYSHESRDFWNCDYEPEEQEAIFDQFQTIFENLVSSTNSILGSPDYFRARPDEVFVWDAPPEPGYTEWLGESEWGVAVWHREKARFHIEIDQGDRELPVMIAVAAMRSDRAAAPDILAERHSERAAAIDLVAEQHSEPELPILTNLLGSGHLSYTTRSLRLS